MSGQVISFTAAHARRALQRQVEMTAEALSGDHLLALLGLSMAGDQALAPHEIKVEGEPHRDWEPELRHLRAVGAAVSITTPTIIGDHVQYRITPFGEKVLAEFDVEIGGEVPDPNPEPPEAA